MAKSHGARQQKRLAKKKAKQSEKRSIQLRRDSKDPNIRLHAAERWPIVRAVAADGLWDTGIGHLLIARQESQGRMVLAVYLIDVYCLGVKNAFWRAGFQADLEDVLHRLEDLGSVSPITPACLAKIVQGAVEYAASLGFEPHPDYRHASLLLEGIDVSTCPNKFTYGRDGKPFYIQGPNESLAEAKAIAMHIQQAQGDFIVSVGSTRVERSLDLDDGFDALEGPDHDEDDPLDDADSPDKSH